MGDKRIELENILDLEYIKTVSSKEYVASNGSMPFKDVDATMDVYRNPNGAEVVFDRDFIARAFSPDNNGGNK